MDAFLMYPTIPIYWETVQLAAKRVLNEVNLALEVLWKERSNIVFEDSYKSLALVLGGRESGLLAILTQPTPPNVSDFRKSRDAYGNMVAKLDRALAALSRYSKSESRMRSHSAPSHVRDARLRIILISTLGAVSGVLFGFFGIWLVFGGGPAGSSIMTLFGQELKTENVGVACVFIGAVTVVVTLRRVLRALEIAIRR